MAIEICSTPEKKIIIKGTNTEIPSVYDRLEYASRIDGITLEIANFIFFNKTFFDNRLPVITDVPVQNIIATINLNLGESQNLAAAEKYAKLAYEEMGYIVNVIE